MTTTSAAQTLNDEQRAVVVKIQKLLQLAGNNPNPAESASAMAKAQEMLAAYNLDMGTVSEGADDGRRAEEKMNGGFYEFERQLWYWVCELNFCMYFNARAWVPRPENEQKHAKVLAFSDLNRVKFKQIRQHKIIGRPVNVAASRAMVEYLLQATERLCREYFSQGLPVSAEQNVVGLSAALRSRRAVNFREGVVETVIDKIQDKRTEALDAEKAAQREAEKRAAEAGVAGVSSSTAVTLSSLRQSERDANMDHVMGEVGYSARVRADRERRAAANRAAEAEMAAWAEAHPEEAAAAEKKRLAEAKKYQSRARSGGAGSRGGQGKVKDWGAVRAGMQAGKSVGLDLQAAHRPAPRGIRHSVAALATIREAGG